MHRYPIVFAILILMAYPLSDVFAQVIDTEQGLVILKPTGQIHNDLQVMEICPDDDPSCGTLRQKYLNSYIEESIYLNDFVQNYLVNTGKISHKEPIYVAFTDRQGGYPVVGFYLREGDRLIDKSGAGYIDLYKDLLTADLNRLDSETQIIPHELGHIFFKQLCEPGVQQEIGSTDVHYFNIITDYQTAFNEGFAEHFETMSALYEPNPEIKEGILNDIVEVPQRTEARIAGFKNDFRWPLRFGFYRATALFWLQRLE